MDFTRILGIVTKGITIAKEVWENRDLAFQALAAVENIAGNAAPTEEDIAKTEADLDALLAEFNAPLPED